MLLFHEEKSELECRRGQRTDHDAVGLQITTRVVIGQIHNFVKHRLLDFILVESRTCSAARLREFDRLFSDALFGNLGTGTISLEDGEIDCAMPEFSRAQISTLFSLFAQSNSSRFIFGKVIGSIWAMCCRRANAESDEQSHQWDCETFVALSMSIGANIV
jgi:hypothetical protein